MKKKLLSGLVVLTSIATLAACGTSKTEAKKVVSTSESSSQVEKSTSSSETITLKESTVVYLTDAEIDAVQTAGDYKKALKSLTDSYVKDFEELIAQLPTSAQEVLLPTRDQITKLFDEQLQTLTEQFDAAGVTDDAAVPEESRDSLISVLKTTRDQLKQAMDTARQQAQTTLDSAQ